jgi:K+-transporting ATPase A subunit
MGKVTKQPTHRLLGGFRDRVPVYAAGGYYQQGKTAEELGKELAGFVETFLIFLVSAGLTCTFGEMVGDLRQGWALFAVMSLLFLAGAFAACAFE